MLPNFTVTPEDDSAIQRYDPKNIIPLRKDFIRTFGIRGEGVILSYLFGRAAHFRRRGKDKHGWFYCTVKLVEQEFDCSYEQQLRIFKALEKTGAITSVQHGNPAKRYIFVHAAKIEKLLEEKRKRVPRYAVFGISSSSGPENEVIPSSGQTPITGSEVVPSSGQTPISSYRGKPRTLIKTEIQVKKTKRESPRTVSGADAPSPDDGAMTPCLVANSVTGNTPGVNPVVEKVARAHGGKKPESILPMPPLQPKATPSQWDRDQASKLRKWVTSRGKFVSRDKNKWAIQFRVLRLQLAAGADFEVAERRIESVLSWYLAAYPKHSKNLPDCWDGNQFKKHFNWIEERMERDLRENPPPAPISPRIQELIDELLRDYRWPKGSEKHVPEAVARSWQFLEDFRRRVLDLAKDGDRVNAKPLPMFCAKCLKYDLQYTREFVKRWLISALKDVANWEDWSGTRKDFLNRAVVSLESDKFQKWGRKTAVGYAGSQTRLWDQLMEATRESH